MRWKSRRTNKKQPKKRKKRKSDKDPNLLFKKRLAFLSSTFSPQIFRHTWDFVELMLLLLLLLLFFRVLFPISAKKIWCVCVFGCFFRSISLPLHIQIYDVLFWLSANAVLCITKTYLPKTHTRIHWFPVPWHWRNSEREREKGDRVKERISLCHLSQKTCGSKILCTHKNIYIAARSIGIWLRIQELCNKLLVVVVVAFFSGSVIWMCQMEMIEVLYASERAPMFYEYQTSEWLLFIGWCVCVYMWKISWCACCFVIVVVVVISA